MRLQYALLVGLLALALLTGCTGGPPAPETPAPVTTESPVPTTAPATPPPVETAAPTLPAEQAEVSAEPTAPSASLAQTVVGVEMHKISDGGGLEQMIAADVTWVRRNGLLWSEIEPQPGERRWEAAAGLEAELMDAAQAGLEVILVVRSAPAWAQGVPGSACGPVAFEQLPALASFLADVVARYSVPPYNVKYWEMGNEPDVSVTDVPPDSGFGCMGNPSDPYYGGGEYAELLKAVYPQIKAADPAAQVLVGGLLLDCDPVNPPSAADGTPRNCTPARFLEGILSSGGGDFFDGVSFHAYDFYTGAPGQYASPNWHSSSDTTGPALNAKARYLRGLLEGYGYPGKFLMNTEVALLCGSSGDEPECQSEAYQSTKAYYLAQANAAAQAAGLKANIWYSTTGWRGSGLLGSDLALTPAGVALGFSAEMLAGAEPAGPLADLAGIQGYEFNREGGRMWIVWSLDGSQHPLELPSDPTAVYDVFGEPLEQETAAGVAPIYIIWEE